MCKAALDPQTLSDVAFYVDTMQEDFATDLYEALLWIPRP